jgi:hypothetical protein
MNLAIYGGTTLAIAGIEGAMRNRKAIGNSLRRGASTFGRGARSFGGAVKRNIVSTPKERAAYRAGGQKLLGHVGIRYTGFNKQQKAFGRAAMRGGRGAFGKGHAFFGNQYIKLAGKASGRRSRMSMRLSRGRR